MTRTLVTDATSTVREVADAPRTIEGLAVPYGVVSGDTELGREVFYPGAFRASVDHWTGRTDGARMAFREAHRKDPVGVVTALRDTPDGVEFRAEIEPLLDSSLDIACEPLPIELIESLELTPIEMGGLLPFLAG